MIRIGTGFKTIIFFLFCLIQCKYKRIDNESYRITKDEKGNLQSELHYINDTILHGVAKYYYSNPPNVLMDEIEYKDGLEQGWRKHYNEKGELISKVEYRNGLADGIDYRFYDDGKIIKSETHWIKGKPFGLGKWFYKNGQLRTINITDFFGQKIWVIQYNEKGIKTNEEGVVVSPKYLLMYANDSLEKPIDENSIQTKEEIVLKINVAEPPGAKTVLQINDKLVNETIELQIENFTAIYKKKFKGKGIHILEINGVMKDIQGDFLKKDSLQIIINVIE